MKSYDERYDVGRQTDRYSPREAPLRSRDDYASGRSDWNRDRRDYERVRYGEGFRREDRDFLDRASDEVSSWFGDREAARRRRQDERREERRHSRRGNGSARRQSFDAIRAGEVMTTEVVTVMPDDTVEQASRLMREYDCGALPVVGWVVV
ncbi:MAG TPA: SWFGD domain-containing protein [Pyrinomonadaceae bacterium]|nr:SWFGD domain-containing protein [Pyrinomonadaceae bacterium]